MKKFITLLIVFTVLLNTYAQETSKHIRDFKNKTDAEITINSIFKIPDFIRFSSQNELDLQGTTLKEKVTSFLNSDKKIFNIKSINEFTFENEKIDEYGLSSIIIKQNYNNIPVFDGELRFHFNKKKKLTAINGNYIPEIDVNTIINISAIQANTIAIQEIEKQQLNNSKQPLIIKSSKIYIFHKGLVENQIGRNYLVYRIEVANELDVREYLFVDANNGKIMEQFTGMAHIDRIVYEGDPSNIVWQEGDAFPGTLSIWQQNEVNVSEQVYNFFKNAFNYNSYDNANAQLRTINNNPTINCPNANWNGSTANYCDGTASDDVIGHEWAHAYTEYTSGLIYSYQSGAMNESYSDIWGETIDLINAYEDAGEDFSLRHSCGSSDRWMIGEDATAFGGSIRDMWDPPCKGDPGKVNDSFNYACSSDDNGGVHTNSGIPNHAYALLVDGGFYNGKTINGIGFIKAAHIFWRAQTQYLTATSDFYNLADALETSCADLIGINLEGLSTTTPAGLSGEVITNSDLNSVISAVLAVELRTSPNACNFETILSPITDLCTASTSNPIFFEDWESGIGNWTVQQLPVQASTWESRDWEIVSNLPNGKPGNAIFGIDPINGNCADDFENGIIRLQSPVITIPQYNSGIFEMAFTHNISTEKDWDGGNLKYTLDGIFWSLVPLSSFSENTYNGMLNDANDNPMHGEVAFTGSDEGSSSSIWGTSIIDFSILGIQPNTTFQTIQFRWELGTDGCNGRVGWYVDDISIYNCSQALAVTKHEIKNNINIYPNPSNGIFTLTKTNELYLEKIEIYDVTGRLLKVVSLALNQNDYKIDLTNISSNIFFFKVVGKDSSTTLKLLKK